MPDKLVSMGEPEEDGQDEEPSASEAISASAAKKQNDATLALSESEFLAMQVPATPPPAVPAGKPARAQSPVSKHDASMWAGSVIVADEFEPLVVPKRPLGRWVFLALFGLGVVSAALYFLWWQPSHDIEASEPAAAKPAEPTASAASAPATQPAAAPAPSAAATPPPAEATPPAAAAAIAPEAPKAEPPVKKKTAGKKKTSSKKKKSSKKKTSSKKKKKKRTTRRGG